MNEGQVSIFVVYTTLVIVMLIVVLLVSFIFSAIKRNRQQILLAEAKLNFERELRQAETEVSEHVMNRFAHELHDNIGQLLTAMNIQIENQKIDHPALSESFVTVQSYLTTVTQQLRLLSHTLNHDYLGHIGLTAAIQLEAERLSTLKRFKVFLEPVHGTSSLEKNQELMVFRIFQEITQNALKHSAAENLLISMNFNNGFELSVKDDGKGFDRQAALFSGKGAGLRNILKRAHLAGMDCEISSQPGEGALFILKNSAP